MKLAESLGYDTAWITDTHLICRELWVTLTACALATSRIRLGPGITVPHTRHISVTASAAVTLEELAPGRVVVGVGTGGSAAQTMGLTLGQTARIATLEAMATSIRRLTQREAIRFESGTEGRLAWLREARRIPVYAAGSGPRMLETAGRVGDGVIMYASVDPAILRAGLTHVAAGARASGRTLDDLDVGLWAPFSIARDGALARDHVAEVQPRVEARRQEVGRQRAASVEAGPVAFVELDFAGLPVGALAPEPDLSARDGLPAGIGHAQHVDDAVIRGAGFP